MRDVPILTTQTREHFFMYLHLGMSVYVWSERIAAMFDVSLFHNREEGGELLNFPKNMTLLRHGLSPDEVKSCILTIENEIHWSNVNCRTLRKRWDEDR